MRVRVFWTGCKSETGEVTDMRMVDLIEKKKRGLELTAEEVNFIIREYMAGEIPDYQMSAFLMAVCLKGMSREETAALTLAFVESGEKADLSQIEGIKVDKHSSGGVGDKLSLIIIPLCALAGIPAAKMSGRGLGHTGGTVDKLESIRGFNTELSRDQFIRNVNGYKMAIIGQSPNLAPADKKIYALRDVTATVDSIPLIASSIMSKKIASGADCIVLDVKAGSGAFMKTVQEAAELAHTMVEIGKSLGRRVVALVTDMSQPLGHEVGNANEVREAIDVLNGKGTEDEVAIALTIASYMSVLGGKYPDFGTAFSALKDILASGKALAKFKELVSLQGGDTEVVDNTDLLPQAANHIEIRASEEGFVNTIDAEKIGVSAMLLGAGRKTKDDIIDHAAGITICAKTGAKVSLNDILCILHTNRDDCDEAKTLALEAFCINNRKPLPKPYIYEVIGDV